MVQRKSYIMGKIVIFFLMLQFIPQTASGAYYWATKETEYWSGDHYYDSGEDEYSSGSDAYVTHSGEVFELLTHTYDSNDKAKAWITYDSGIPEGEDDGYEVTTAGTYRAEVGIYFSGVLDASTYGSYYSNLKISISLYYYSGGYNEVGSFDYEISSDQNWDNKWFNWATSGGYVSGEFLHVEITIELFAQGSPQEGDIDNDFSSGANEIELVYYRFQRWEPNPCPPIC